jgi:hypothetical protein
MHIKVVLFFILPSSSLFLLINRPQDQEFYTHENALPISL